MKPQPIDRRQLGRVVIGLAAAWLALLSTPAPAQSLASPHPSLPILNDHAPLIWLADNEPFKPTLPHALAFDGIDNDDDWLVDFADPDEVAFGGGWTPEVMLAQWRKLVTQPPVRVMAACRTRAGGPCGLGETHDDGTDYDHLLQFWFYYFADIGVGPHVADNEHAFVYLKGRNGECVKAVVGASHDPSTANNILVGACVPPSGSVSVKNIVPEHLPAHMPILVELGKHASAPDLDLNGRFDVGFDANVFRHSVWGSRDTIASSFGALDLTPYETWRSFPRSPAHLFVDQGFDANRGAYWDRYLAVIKEAPKTNRSSVFPIEDMIELYRLIDRGDKPAVIAFLLEHQVCFWGKPIPSLKISDDVFDRMKIWPRQKKEAMAWKHEDYVDPHAIFKSHLYPPFAIRGGWVREQEQNDWFHIAIQMAEVPLPRWPRRFRGTRLFNGSSLEVGGSWGPSSGANWRSPGFRGFNAIVKGWRGNRYGYFIGLSGRKASIQSGAQLTPKHLKEIAAETGRTEEFLLAYPHRKAIRLGVTGGVGGEIYVARHVSMDARLGLIVEQRNTAVDDVARALGDKSNIRFTFNVGFLYGRFPSNPLRR